MTESKPGGAALRPAALIGAASAVALLVAFLLVPVTFSTPDPPPADQATAWVRVPEPARSRVVIEQAEPATTVVALALTRPQGLTDALVTGTDGWTYDEAARSWRADGPARLVVEGVFGDLTVTLLDGTTAGVTITRPGTPTLALDAPGAAGWAAALVESPTDRFESTKPLFRALVRLDDMPGDDVSAQAAGVAISSGDLADHGARAVVLAGVGAVAAGLALLGVAGLVLAVGWALGRSLDRSARVGTTATILRAGAGCLLLALGVNTLAYVVPTRWAALIVLLAGIAGIATGWRRVARRQEAGELLATGRLGLWLAPALTIGFLPAVFWGARWIGAFNTDIFEYSTLASIARDHSLFAMQDLPLAQSSGTLTSGAGISWRAIDSLAVAALSLLPGVNVVQAFTILAAVLFLLGGLAALALATESGGGRWHRGIVGLALLAPLFTGLFVEGYFSHYFFVAIVPLSVLSAWIAMRQTETGWLRLSELTAVAAAACMIAVYPYFAAIVLAAIGGALLLSPGGRRFARQRGGLVLLGTVGLTNLAFLTVLNYGATTINQDALNAITRWTLLAPFSTAQMFGLGAGVVPYQWHPADTAAHPWMGTVGAAIWATGEGARSLSPFAWGTLALVAVAGLAAAIRWRATVRSYPAITWALIVGAFAGLGVLLALTGSPYSALKAGWTAAALLPLTAATVVLRPSRAAIALVLMVPMALLWTRASLLDRVEYLIPRSAPVVLQESHSSVEPDVAAVRAAIDGATTVAVLVGPEPLAGSDKDRVAHAHVLVALREMAIDCEGCELDVASLTPAPRCPAEPVQALIVIGRTARDELCGHRLSTRGNLVEVFR